MKKNSIEITSSLKRISNLLGGDLVPFQLAIEELARSIRRLDVKTSVLSDYVDSELNETSIEDIAEAKQNCASLIEHAEKLKTNMIAKQEDIARIEYAYYNPDLKLPLSDSKIYRLQQIILIAKDAYDLLDRTTQNLQYLVKGLDSLVHAVLP